MENRIEAIIKERERKKMISELQSAAEKDGHIPPMPRLLLRKMEKPLQFTGGAFWGILLGMFSFVVTYVLVVMIFHIGL
jgi:hypothetical protein